MLTFDGRFASDEKLGCVLWADGLSQRVRFAIGHQILIEILGGQNPIAHDRNVALCERERARIEAACRRAFSERPSDRVELQARDFQ
jgi:hypothetical protein